MKVKTNLPHEAKGGHTLALFGKPHIMYRSKLGHTAYVNCHFIAAKETGIGQYDFREIFFEFNENTKMKMQAHARMLVENHIRSRLGWSIKRGSGKYVSCKNWQGFCFKINF